MNFCLIGSVEQAAAACALETTTDGTQSLPKRETYEVPEQMRAAANRGTSWFYSLARVREERRFKTARLHFLVPGVCSTFTIIQTTVRMPAPDWQLARQGRNWWRMKEAHAHTGRVRLVRLHETAQTGLIGTPSVSFSVSPLRDNVFWSCGRPCLCPTGRLPFSSSPHDRSIILRYYKVSPREVDFRPLG